MGLFLFFEKGGICREGLFCFYLFLLEKSLFIGYTMSNRPYVIANALVCNDYPESQRAESSGGAVYLLPKKVLSKQKTPRPKASGFLQSFTYLYKLWTSGISKSSFVTF